MLGRHETDGSEHANHIREGARDKGSTHIALFLLKRQKSKVNVRLKSNAVLIGGGSPNFTLEKR